MLEILSSTASLVDIPNGKIYRRVDLIRSIAQRTDVFRLGGVRAGDHIVIARRDGCGALVDLFSAWQIGATAVMVPGSLTPVERENVARTVKARAWVGETAPDETIHFECASLATEGRIPPDRPTPLPLDAPALILMTSGTTSAPKGVVHTLRTLTARLALNQAHIHPGDMTRSLSVLPMHFGHGLIGNSLTPLSMGGTLALWHEPGVAGLSQLGSTLDDHDITFISSVPAMWRVALRLSPRPSRRSLRRVHIGSAPLSAELWESVAEWAGTRRVVNTYGITETANWIGGHSLEDGPAEDGLVGRPWGGAIAVMGENGSILPEGRGPILVSTPSLMKGYFERADLTESACLGPWFVTGDTGVIGADGRLRMIGRRQNEINRGGLKIPAEEIDLLLEAHPEVHEACAFPLHDSIAGEVVGVAVALENGAAVMEEDLIAWCRERIRAEAVPGRIFVLPELPRTDRGKLNRDTVRKAALGGVRQNA